MLTIRQIKEPAVTLFHYHHRIGEIDNELTLLDIRRQIKQKGLEGCYLTRREEFWSIDSNGKIKGEDGKMPFVILDLSLCELLN